ncbi:alpha/beta hydrolase [Stenotrophobium rhamnosiphilum]|uniref:Alpha/beta hydrolase n=1 Tax=Stenotrophobium rhamnosiphilum TaxID=2029166 RepID=A0A2T5MGY3_9GAMM|nr:alpha/beta hydrolase [Stenotrophobium rhamnosiphilum]PTU31841.1 alpha/beta hydrolase [Stenotrophobium rhamnosiphilum]
MSLPSGYGWKLRLAFNAAILMRKLGLYPNYDAVAKWPAAKRKALKPANWATFPPPASVKMNRETIASRGGPMEVKWFRTKPDQAPSILFIHGGGWVVGGLDSLDYLCSNLCDRLGVAVVAVDYRLAPDHKFPSGLEDCYDALKWVAAQAPGPVTVIGDSAGGNLSAALCILARDSGGPAIAHQTLIYPALDLMMESQSLITNADGLASRDDLAMVAGFYLGDHDPRDPLVSPIHAKNLRDLPPAFIVTADCDLLRDDGPRYAECLRAAGVRVRYENYPNMPHAFLSQPKLCPGAAGALTDIIEEMRPHLQSQVIS